MSVQAILETLVAASGNPIAAVALKATAAMLAALLLIRAARRGSASLRHLLAAVGFGVLLLLPLAAALAPARLITVRPPAAAAPAKTQPAVGRAGSAVPGPAATATATRGRFPGVRLVDVAYGIYLMGAAGLVASLLTGIWRLRGVCRRAEVSVQGTRLANETARQLGLPGGIEVALSSELAVPMTFGWTHPVILLPQETADWGPAELARALRHELEHIARGDWAIQVVSHAALALYWPHPMAWALWARLRLEAERACDDAVIRAEGQAESYAEQLVSLARRLRGRGVVPALSMATRSNLGLRVDAILDGRQHRGPRSRLTALLGAAGAVACLLTIAPLRVVAATVTPVDDLTSRDDHDDDGHDDEGDPLDVALLQAAERGNLVRMRTLLDRGAKAGAVLDGDGTPLIAAARQGRLAALQLLLDAGADVNRGVDGDGNALTMAAKGGHLDAVRLLLDRGANIDLGVEGDGNPLIMAAGDGQLDVVRFLLDKGAQVEKVVLGDENPLIHASEGGHADVVRLLLERGANVNARVWSDSGPRGAKGEWRTALLMARRNGHEDVVRILRAAGARE
jgi:beta-lactamase regulating signal transducer with metallopeptidase domain